VISKEGGVNPGNEWLPTDDSVPDGTQLPEDDVAVAVPEEGDAGVPDTGDEPWYSVADDD
jgi:hypothetical protein